MGTLVAVGLGVVGGSAVGLGTLPGSPEQVILQGAYGAALVRAVRLWFGIRRWRAALRLGGDGDRSAAATLARWTLGASLLLGACTDGSDTPVFEAIGTAPETTLPTSTTTEAPPTTPTTNSPPTTPPPTTRPPAADTGEDTDPVEREAAPAEPTAEPVAAEAARIADALDRLPTSHVVQSGEHLWGIARTHVGVDGTPADGERVADYWRHLVEVNRPTLRSGDPDLIHPGEVLLLPAPDGPGNP